MIRKEQPKDIASIRSINVDAFPTKAESYLVDQLRSEESSFISLVAEERGKVIGHIMFSPVTISENPENINLCGLAPMAVHPDFQRNGVGAKLIKAGRKACKRQGFQIVVVLGHADYYPRFGFRAAGQFNITCQYDVPSEAFMVMELEPNALNRVSGLVKYHELFNDV